MPAWSYSHSSQYSPSSPLSAAVWRVNSARFMSGIHSSSRALVVHSQGAASPEYGLYTSCALSAARSAASDSGGASLPLSCTTELVTPGSASLRLASSVWAYASASTRVSYRRDISATLAPSAHSTGVSSPASNSLAQYASYAPSVT